jgi:hypothetical protein
MTREDVLSVCAGLTCTDAARLGGISMGFLRTLRAKLDIDEWPWTLFPRKT